MQAWVAQAIRAEAGARSMNIRQLALKAGIADKVLRRALDCERPFHLSQMIKVAGALDLSLTYLVQEAERRQSIATPQARAAAMIEADMTLTRSQKSDLLGLQNARTDDVGSQNGHDPRGDHEPNE